MLKTLGKLEKVNPRDIWKTEDKHFTPWLAQDENISLLGEAIGMNLEVEAQEKSVGPFRADILCMDTSNDSWVLIENQLERTDHTHLGQLMTYASGLKAVTIVWIAKKFTEEHRSSLDWLNEITDDTFNFFGLEIELWKIGNSSIGPRFNVISKPNNWTRSVVAATNSAKLTDGRLLQREFWQFFADYLRNNNSIMTPTKPLPQQWMNLSVGKSGLKICPIVSFFNSELKSWSTNEIRVEFNMDGPSAKSHFNQFLEHKLAIEESIGDECVWHNPEDKKSAKIYLRKTVDVRDKEDWNNQHKWLMEKCEIFKNSFSPYFSELIDD